MHLLRTRILLLLIWILLLPVVSTARQQGNDSLRDLKGKERINYLINLGKDLIYKDPDKAGFAVENALETARILGLKEEEATALRLSGNVKYVKGAYPEALDSFQKSYLLYKELDDSTSQGRLLSNIGLIFKNLKQYPMALENYRKAFDIFLATNDSTSMSRLFNNLGVVYKNLESYDSARYYYLLSLKGKQQKNDEKGIASTLTNLGVVSFLENEYEAAENYFQQSIEIEEKLGNTEGVVRNLNNLAKIYFENKRAEAAYQVAYRAYGLAKEMNTTLQINESSEVLYQYFKQKNMHKKALEFYEIHAASSQSLSNEESARAIGRMESRLELSAQQNEIAALKRERELNELELSKKRILVISLIVILFLIIAAVIVYFRFQKNKHELLKKILTSHVMELGLKVNQLSAKKNTVLNISFEDLNDKLITPISRREYEVLQQVFSKKTNREIAESLHVSLNTIKTHLKNLYDKLGVNNRTDAIELIMRKS
ncbi:MAG: tetratricopeptide repeat protein [Bacteroidota bacterium]